MTAKSWGLGRCGGEDFSPTDGYGAASPTTLDLKRDVQVHAAGQQDLLEGQGAGHVGQSADEATAVVRCWRLPRGGYDDFYHVEFLELMIAKMKKPETLRFRASDSRTADPAVASESVLRARSEKQQTRLVGFDSSTINYKIYAYDFD